MKHIFRLLALSSLLAVVLVACKKDEHKDYYIGGNPPVLSSSVTAPALSFANKDNALLTLSWTNPTYRFSTGSSSQDVSYQIEIDTAGANFTNPQKQTVSVSRDVSITFTGTQFNDYLLNQLALKADISHNIEVRVKSSLGGSALTTYISNTLSFKLTPYSTPPKVAVPDNGTLWLTGDAMPSGYANPLGSPYDVTQKFTQVSNTLYELTLNMPGGGAYKLIQKQGDWSTQYHMLTGGTAEAGDFEKKDSDPGFPGPAASGTYKLSVDFQRGKYTLTKL